MRLLSFTIAMTLLAGYTFAEQPLRLKDIKPDDDRKGLHPLDVGFCGTFTKRLRTFDFDDPRPDNPIEFAHVSFPPTHVRTKKRIGPEIVVGHRRATDGRVFYGIRTVILDSIPTFDTLKTIGTVGGFERIFGGFRGWTDSWGSTALDGKTEMHASKFWRGCVRQDDGTLRVVNVFVSIVDYGDSWVLESVDLREGVFRSAERPPVLQGEKAEP